MDVYKDKGNDKIIDGHLHIEDIYNENGVSFLDGFDEYIEKSQVKTVNIAALPSGKRDVSNNILAAFYKLTHDGVFAHGGLTYTSYPAPNPAPEGMDPLTQYKELMEIGFDGIKMLEGKPQLHKMISIALDDEYFDGFLAEAEKDKTHVLFHVNDPEDFWDPKNKEWLSERGWYYGDGDYASNEEVYRQIFALLEKHPNLCATFAHFFFFSNAPERLEKMFAKYPNTAVDLTPGGEMYLAFQERPDYYKEFFKKYSERVLFGTDSTFPYSTNDMLWLNDRVYSYIATNETFLAFSDKDLTGIELPQECKNNILFANFERRVSKKPRKINKKALKKYIDKYRHLIREEAYVKEIERLEKLYL